MRIAKIERKTLETEVLVEINLDGNGDSEINTGIGFLDHMLTLMAFHGSFDLTVSCSGDLYVDEHHTVEDVALTIGQAIRQALGDKIGIGRYGFLLPMDEASAQIALDLCGRAYFLRPLRY